MPDLDSRLSQSLRRLVRMDESDDAFEVIRRRRARRRTRRRVEAVALAVVVLATAAGTTFALVQAFRPHGGRVVGGPLTGNGQIAVFRAEGSDPSHGQIYVLEPDGSGIRRLTDEGNNIEPAWSPDGSQIAFVSDRDSVPGSAPNLDVYVMDADASHIRRLTRDDQRAYSPAWSPDGSRIALVSDCLLPREGMCEVALYVVNPDGSGAQRISTRVSYLARGVPEWSSPLSWSPDGSRIAFSALPEAPPEPSPESCVTKTLPGGGSSVDCTATAGVVTTDETVVATIGADGSGLTMLSSGPHDYSPAWSPDGARIAFTREEGGRSGIFVMNADGSGVTRLTEGPADSDPVWAPDGTQIAFVRGDVRGGPGDVWVMNADGSGQHALTTDGGYCCPAWQPVPASATVVSPSPSAPSEQALLKEIGPACGASKTTGDFDGDGGTDTAIVYLPEPSGGCDAATGDDRHHLFVAWSSGSTNGWELPQYSWKRCYATKPLTMTCDDTFVAQVPVGTTLPPGPAEELRAFAAPDVNQDGKAELVIEKVEGATTSLLDFFELNPGAEPQPIMAGTYEWTLLWGGTATNQDTLRCERSGDGTPEVIATSSELDQQTNEWKVLETTYRLSGAEPVASLPQAYRYVPTDSPEAVSLRVGSDICGAPAGGESLSGSP